MSAEVSRTRVFSAPRPSVAPDRSRALRLITLTCVGLAGLGAAIGLLGWALDEPALERLAPGLATMKFNTALALLLLAGAYAVPCPTGSAAARLVARICATAAGVLAGLQLLEYALQTDLGIDQLVVTDRGGSAHPGRTSIAAAACLVLLATCALSTGARSVARRLRQGLALVTAAVSGMALLGYAYNVHSLYALNVFSTIALNTALGLALLSVAALTSTEHGAIAWALFGHDAGAAITRRLGPLALLGLPAIGLACVGADRAGWLDGITTVALTVVLCTIVFAAATWASAVRIARLDRERQDSVQDLTDLKRTLERQVAARAEQLRSRHDEIAVLEDRQRIAADIHDVVIQRLFAAGMFLHGTPDTDPATQARIDTAIESMDTAIKELRASIFELGGHAGRSVDLAAALDDVCVDAARVLGFHPDVVVDDPDREAETVRDDLLAVVRESLSNVARHAAASSVEVVLRSGHGLISLTVTDDGRGMTRTPHSSGTRNMAERARQRGGDCVWTTVQPHGTRVWWHVPGAPLELALDPTGALDDDPRQLAADTP